MQRVTTWRSVFREPHLFGMALLVSLAVFALVEGLVVVSAFAFLLTVVEAILLKMSVRSKYKRGA